MSQSSGIPALSQTEQQFAGATASTQLISCITQCRINSATCGKLLGGVGWILQWSLLTHTPHTPSVGIMPNCFQLEDNFQSGYSAFRGLCVKLGKVKSNSLFNLIKHQLRISDSFDA